MINGVRQFKLINGNGTEYDMTRPDAFFNAPDGLGWGTEADIERLGMTYIALNEREIHQTPTGEMIFRSYAEYANFLSFCQVGGLVFCYKPRDTWYFVKCIISIQKSEIQYTNDHLICPVEITTTSYWYERVVAQTADPEQSEYSKTYSYTYSYQYGSGTVNAFDFDMALPSYFKLTIFGEATNPVYRLLQNGVVIHSGKILTSVASNQKLIINTNPKEMEIGLYTTNNIRIANRYGYSDFNTERMFSIPAGQTQLQVLTDDENPPKIMIEVLRHV